MRRRMQRLFSGGAIALIAMTFSFGCHTPLVRTEAGDLEASEPAYRNTVERTGVAKQIALYIPNRIVDAVDIVSASVGLDLGLGFDVRVTRWGQLALQAGVGIGVGYDDRSHQPAWANAGATAALGPWRGGGGAGNAPSLGTWEIGLATGANKFAVDLAEIVDFVLGWFFIDILKDDYGWS